MTTRSWRPALALAAATAMATPAAADTTKEATYDIRAEWLDPAVVDHPKAHDRIMAEMANEMPLNARRLDVLGLNPEAARAFSVARNTWELHMPRYDQTPRDWFKAVEPQLAQIVADHRQARRTQAAYVLGGMGTMLAGGAGLVAWKRRRAKAQAVEPAAPGASRDPQASRDTSALRKSRVSPLGMGG
ncbi:MAG: LPXTG cell wall anchor domain-containing protein [Pseudomonadota bacterium]